MRSAILGGLLALFASTAMAEDVTVDMWTMQPDTKESNAFSPGIVTVKAGDTVVWVAQQAGHNIEFIDGAVPEGVEAFRSGFDKEVRYKFDKPGVYAYKCLPHYGLGMVGFIVVGGDYQNFDQVNAFKFPGMAKQRAQSLLAKIAEMKAQ